MVHLNILTQSNHIDLKDNGISADTDFASVLSVSSVPELSKAETTVPETSKTAHSKPELPKSKSSLSETSKSVFLKSELPKSKLFVSETNKSVFTQSVSLKSKSSVSETSKSAFPQSIQSASVPSLLTSVFSSQNKITDIGKNILNEHNQKIMQEMSIKISPTMVPLKSDKEIASSIFIDYVVKKNSDTQMLPVAQNTLSAQKIVNLGLNKELQRLNINHSKSFTQNNLKKTSIDSNNEEDDDNDDDDFVSIGSTVKNSAFNTLKNADLMFDNHGLSNHHTSFSGQTKEYKQEWIPIKDSDINSGILTHDLSKKCIDFIKNQGNKRYYDDIYLRFHKDDIIKTAYILDDAKLYDYLLQTGQLTPDDIKKLPILGRNQTVVSAHYQTLMTPEFMCEFLHHHKLINIHIYDDFLNIFKNKPWFHSGGLQTLMQMIGGEFLNVDEISFFVEWYKTHTEEFEQLFDFFDIESEYSLIRPNENGNMRSKHMTSDSIKAFYFSGLAHTLKSANDPLLDDFFDLDFTKLVDKGFYKGLNYIEYLNLHGVDTSKINIKMGHNSLEEMSDSAEAEDYGYLLNAFV